MKESFVKKIVNQSVLACCIFLIVQVGVSFFASALTAGAAGLFGAVFITPLLLAPGSGMESQFQALHDILNKMSSLASSVTLFFATFFSGLSAVDYCRKKMDVVLARENFQKPKDFKRLFKYASAVFTMSAVFGSLFSIVQALFGLTIEQPDVFMESQSFTALLTTFITVGIAAPVLEELFFRGYLLQNLGKVSKAFGLFASSFLFALMHMNLAQGIPTFFMGMLFGLYFVKTNNLAGCILLHIFNNMIALLSSFMVLSIPLSILIYGMAFYGLVILIKKRREIKSYFYSYSLYPTKDAIKVFFKQPAVWVLVIGFLISSIVVLF